MEAYLEYEKAGRSNGYYNQSDEGHDIRMWPNGLDGQFLSWLGYTPIGSSPDKSSLTLAVIERGGEGEGERKLVEQAASDPLKIGAVGVRETETEAYPVIRHPTWVKNRSLSAA